MASQRNVATKIIFAVGNDLYQRQKDELVDDIISGVKKMSADELKQQMQQHVETYGPISQAKIDLLNAFSNEFWDPTRGLYPEDENNPIIRVASAAKEANEAYQVKLADAREAKKVSEADKINTALDKFEAGIKLALTRPQAYGSITEALSDLNTVLEERPDMKGEVQQQLIDRVVKHATDAPTLKYISNFLREPAELTGASDLVDKINEIYESQREITPEEIASTKRDISDLLEDVIMQTVDGNVGDSKSLLESVSKLVELSNTRAGQGLISEVLSENYNISINSSNTITEKLTDVVNSLPVEERETTHKTVGKLSGEISLAATRSLQKDKQEQIQDKKLDKIEKNLKILREHCDANGQKTIDKIINEMSDNSIHSSAIRFEKAQQMFDDATKPGGSLKNVASNNNLSKGERIVNGIARLLKLSKPFKSDATRSNTVLEELKDRQAQRTADAEAEQTVTTTTTPDSP